MSAHRMTLPSRKVTFSQLVAFFQKFIYPYPRLLVVVLMFVIGIISIYGYGVLNYDAVLAMYAKRTNTEISPTAVSPALVAIIPTSVTAAYVLMLTLHALCGYVLLSIGKQFGLGQISLWALVFLLSSHLLLNDYRQYIFIAPLYWLLCLLALWAMSAPRLPWHARLGLAMVCMYFAAGINVIAWAWVLLLLPLFWVFRTRDTELTLSFAWFCAGSYLVVVVLFFLPHVLGQFSGYRTLMSLIENRQSNIDDVGQMLSSAWLRDEDSVMSFLFLSAGSFTVVLLRTLFSLGFVSLFLLIYAGLKRQFAFLPDKTLRVLLTVIAIDIALTAMYLFIRPDYASSAFFIQVLLLLLLAAPGLAYVFRKLQQGRYDAHWQLMIGWIIVGYVMSGTVSFGPSNTYLREAGEAYRQHEFVSNHAKIMFYGDKNPLDTSFSLSDTDNQTHAAYDDQWVLYQLGRDKTLPKALQTRQPVEIYVNRHDDKVLVFAPKRTR